jgi:hypothetical protein
MDYEFYVGINVLPEAGTTVSVIEKAAGKGEDPHYHTRHIQKIQNGAGPADVARRIREIISNEPFAGRSIVVVNETEKQGRELARELAAGGLTPVGVHVSESDGATQLQHSLTREETGDIPRESTGGFIVGRSTLVGTLVDLHQSGQFRIEQPDGAAGDALMAGIGHHADTLDGERAGNRRFEPLHNDEEDAFVLSAALAAWFGEQRNFDVSEGLGGEPPPTGEVRKELRPDTGKRRTAKS